MSPGVGVAIVSDEEGQHGVEDSRVHRGSGLHIKVDWAAWVQGFLDCETGEETKRKSSKKHYGTQDMMEIR
jgi:hypothetical protein